LAVWENCEKPFAPHSIQERAAVAKTTIDFGVLLIALALAAFFGTGTVSWTALIPSFVGLPLVILGRLALNEHWRKHAMHAAVIIGLIGFLGGAYSFIRPFIFGSEVKPVAACMQMLLALICAIFVGLCVKSFIDARRARTQKMD
jgi:nitrate/nitrite transporter NarK